ncbi:MAG: PD-(D/E)XK nuclease family transposase [Bacteroidia bacterium]|nr:PD-(D/E)XK nuclease family transposase [Bacteroidia bacterium]
MMLARLDNEVFFKKAFTDRQVLKAFVKDIVGIEVNPERIETEKAFQPRLGNINFKYDIFAEDSQKRIIIEIQKVEYDHNFDRFLHYHLQAITEQQRNSDDYSVGRTVYTIVVMTAPYRINEKTREIYKDEVLISSLNPKNFKGIERKIFNHELIYLNPNYKSSQTPKNYQDWLDLIYESIHSPENPKINLDHAGIKRATEIIQFENISPEEWEMAKIEVGKQKVIQLATEERILEIARKLIKRNLSDEEIAEDTGLSIIQIQYIRNEIDTENYS